MENTLCPKVELKWENEDIEPENIYVKKTLYVKINL